MAVHPPNENLAVGRNQPLWELPVMQKTSGDHKEKTSRINNCKLDYDRSDCCNCPTMFPGICTCDSRKVNAKAGLLVAKVEGEKDIFL